MEGGRKDSAASTEASTAASKRKRTDDERSNNEKGAAGTVAAAKKRRALKKKKKKKKTKKSLDVPATNAKKIKSVKNTKKNKKSKTKKSKNANKTKKSKSANKIKKSKSANKTKKVKRIKKSKRKEDKEQNKSNNSTAHEAPVGDDGAEPGVDVTLCEDQGPSEVDIDNSRLMALLHSGKVKVEDERFDDPLQATADAKPVDDLPVKATAAVNQPPETRDPCKTVFFANLSYDVDEDAMEKLLTPYGSRTELRWLEDPKSGQFKGCAWAVFEDSKDATTAAAALHNSEFMGRTIKALLTPDKYTKGNGKSGLDFDTWPKPAAPVSNYEAVARCFVGNLPYVIDEEIMSQHFKKANPEMDIDNVLFITDKETGKFYGSSFVTFTDPKGAAWAVASNGMPINGRPAKITFAPPKRRAAAMGSGASGRNARQPTPRPEGGTTTAFFGNLNFEIEDQNMMDFCKDAGSVKEIRWLTHQDSGQFKGCGFVEFHSCEAVDKIVKKNGEVILGRAARIDYA